MRCTVTGAGAHISLERPEVHNALNKASIASLTRAFVDLDARVRWVLVTGVGKSFCAGADLNDMQQSVHQTPEKNRADAEALSQLFAAVRQAPQVVIACVQGAALGGGAGLASCCDLVVAERSARFGFTEARLGLAPAVIAPHVVARLGQAHARRLFLTADIIDADAALAVGLVDAVVDEGGFEAVVAAWQQSILRNGPKACARIKALLRELEHASEKAGAQLCIDTISQLRTGDEGQAGLEAFLHKRAPPWTNP